MVYLARGSVYHINVLEWSRWICIDFGFSRTEELDEACVFSDVGIERKNDFQHFLLHWMSNEENGDPRAFEILYKIYADLLQLQGKRAAPSSNLFSHAVEYIVSRYTDASLSVETIAAEVGVSTVHLRRIFAANAGTSPIQYVNLVRLEQAKMLLSVSNLSIGEIAAQTGFSDPFYFSKVFKKHVGLPPAAYRKSGGEGQQAQP